MRSAMRGSLILLLALMLCSVALGKLWKKQSTGPSQTNLTAQPKAISTATSTRQLKPQPPPHPDQSFIIEFVGDGVEGCKQMEPLVKQLEQELGTKVRRVNIGRRQDFAALFDLVGGNEGGNLPFFYNRRTAQAICGPTTYSNLLKLGTSDRRHMFFDAPIDGKEMNENVKRNSGFMGYLEGLGKSFVRRKTDALLDKLMNEEK